jgi:hypothetical protein
MVVDILEATKGFAEDGPSAEMDAEDEDMLGLGTSPGTARRASSMAPSCVDLAEESSELLPLSPGVPG